MVGCPLFDYQPFTGARQVGHGLTLGQLETYLLWGYKRAAPGLLKNEKPCHWPGLSGALAGP